MKKLFGKMKKVRMTRWSMLTTGEKVMKVVMKLIKYAVIAALAAAAVSVVVAVGFGLLVGFGIMSAVAGGFTNASRAYRPGDCYIWFR